MQMKKGLKAPQRAAVTACAKSGGRINPQAVLIKARGFWAVGRLDYQGAAGNGGEGALVFGDPVSGC